MTTELADKHIVVTGGTGGLGSAVVARLLEAGATCHVPCIEAQVPAHLPWAHSDRVSFAFNIDLANEDSVSSFYRSTPGLWASIHLAGGFAMAPILETSLAEFDRQHTLNASTCFLSCREAVRNIRATGNGGRLVNVAARPVLSPVAGMAAYAASKASVAALTQTLAAELVAEDILVNAVIPSIIDTPANRKAMPTADHTAWPKASEIAATILFLVSPNNRLTHGTFVPIYGRA